MVLQKFNNRNRKMAELSNKKNVLNNANKSKKSKNDLIRAAVGQYLKQKSYVGSEKFRKSDFMLLQNKKQFVFNKMIEGDLKKSNSFVYSNVLCLNNNQHIVEQQFGKFSQFIESQNEYIRAELRRFYAPIICHLYLELIKATESKAAVDFLKKYAHLVAPVENYEAPLPTKINGCSMPSDAAAVQEDGIGAPLINTQIKFSKININPGEEEDTELEFFTKLIQLLSTCAKYETAENIEEVRLFRCSKYELYVTDEVINTLNAFLQKKGHVLIVNLLYTWIQVNIIDNEIRQWTEDYLFNGPDEDDEDMPDEILKPNVLPNVAKKREAEEIPEVLETDAGNEAELAEKKGRERNVALCLKTIRESSEKFFKTQTSTPRFIKLADKCRGLTSAHFDQNECHLVAGFDNSVVHLWQMNQQTNKGQNIFKRFTDTTCQWELNNYYAEEDDEIERDIKLHEEEENYCDKEMRNYNKQKYEENSVNDYGGVQLRGHNRGVTDVCFSSYYPLIYSVSKDATMRSWRAENYACAAVYSGHSYPIWCVAESPAGMYTATGSKDLTARLWSLEREFPLITYVGHTQDVDCLAFHPNGNYIATGSVDLSVRLWCVTSGKLMRVFSDCKQPVTSIAFSPDGKMLAAGGEESKIRIFDLAAGAQLGELKEHPASVTSIAWNTSGRLLASACQDGSLRLWDVTKLSPMHDSSSNSATSSSSSSGNRLLALNSNCERLVKVLFHRNDTLSCVGS